MLDKLSVLKDVKRALEEDIQTGDISAALLPDSLRVTAHILSREPMLLAGVPWVEAVWHEVDETLQCHWFAAEGAWLQQPQTLCMVEGKAKSILTAERTALNFLQTLSATATQTHFFVEKIKGTNAKILDTRKTLPGLRYAQKYAVRCGGGSNHRMGLYDAFLIKENHIRALGSIQRAVQLARATASQLTVEVEVESLDELQAAFEACPDRILLDNFSIEAIKRAVDLNRDHGYELEASGSVTLDTVREVAETGVDFISIGRLTKSVSAIDLSLLVEDEH